MDISEKPIAVFDSGVGGISVLRELVRLLPNENYIYFGDSKNAPYGTKSTDEVRRLTILNTEKLFSLGAKAIVVACNTATSAAIDFIRASHKDKIVIGIEPALKPAAENRTGTKIAVMATPVTLREEKFCRLMQAVHGQNEIIELPCPHLVELVEGGKAESDETYNYLKDIFNPYINSPPDAVVLGCTHFPFAKNVLKRLLPNAEFFDGGEGTAKETMRRLKNDGILNLSGKKGNIRFIFSAPEEERIANMLFNA